VSSIDEKQGRRQAVPDPLRGVVFGVDVSKSWIDWRACRLGEWGRRQHARQNRPGFLSFEQQLREQVEAGQEVWVAFEPTGPYSLCLQEWLLARKWRTVLVNPYHVHRTAEIPDNSPQKDDGKDPRVIADLVWRGSYHRPRSVAGPYAELRAGIAEWESLTKKHTAARNEAQALLAVWFPELQGVWKDPLCKGAQAVIRHYESPQALARAPRRSVERKLAEATHGRGRRSAEPAQAAAMESVALTEGQRSRVRALRTLLDELARLEARRETLRGEMAAWVDETREGEYLLSLPWIGPVVVGGLLGECGPFPDFRRFAELEKFVGLNLYGRSSGQRHGRRRLSKRGRSGARKLLGQYAASHVKEGGLCYAWAQQQRAKGKEPLQIQMAVARKLLRVMHGVSTHEQRFDRGRWCAGVKTADDERAH
jgi:transposase